MIVTKGWSSSSFMDVQCILRDTLVLKIQLWNKITFRYSIWIPFQNRTFAYLKNLAIFLRCTKKISSWCPLREEEFVTKRPEEASEGFILSVERLAPGLKMPQSQKSKGWWCSSIPKPYSLKTTSQGLKPSKALNKCYYSLVREA